MLSIRVQRAASVPKVLQDTVTSFYLLFQRQILIGRYPVPRAAVPNFRIPKRKQHSLHFMGIKPWVFISIPISSLADEYFATGLGNRKAWIQFFYLAAAPSNVLDIRAFIGSICVANFWLENCNMHACTPKPRTNLEYSGAWHPGEVQHITEALHSVVLCNWRLDTLA